MQGIAGHVDARKAEIITRIWVAGIIPFMVGLALIINGLVVSKKMVEIQEREREKAKSLEEGKRLHVALRPADTSSLFRLT